MWERYIYWRYEDLHQRAAQNRIHDDLTKSASRVQVFLGAVTVTATLLGTLVFALVNGLFGTMIKMTDEQTGTIRGMTTDQIDSTLGSVGTLLVTIAATVLLAAVLMVWHASGRDDRRATAQSWIEEYSRARAQTDAAAARVAQGGAGPSRLTDLLKAGVRSILDAV